LSQPFLTFKLKLVAIFLCAKNSVQCETHLVVTAAANLCSRLFYSELYFSHRRATAANCQRFPPQIYVHVHSSGCRQTSWL